MGGSMTGLQWVVDGYTLMFAALLLSAGSLSDRIGAPRVRVGLALFVAASVACGLAPSLGALVVARFVQGAAAAIMMPSSMALIGQAYPDPIRRARAVAMWAMGGAVASSSGSVLGGFLTLVSWRMIFFVQEADPSINDQIDAAYHTKYRRYASYVPPMISCQQTRGQPVKR